MPQGEWVCIKGNPSGEKVIHFEGLPNEAVSLLKESANKRDQILCILEPLGRGLGVLAVFVNPDVATINKLGRLKVFPHDFLRTLDPNYLRK